MSRVDEALRRAAEQAATSPINPVIHAPVPNGPLDATALAEEPFPIEIKEHKRTPAPKVAPEPQSVVAEPAPAKAASAPLAPPSLTEEPGGLLERMSGTVAEKIVVDDNMSSTSREQYRRLAAILHHSQQSTGLTVVMVTSAVPGEGKTLTCTNLALTLSESYQRRVLLIDADLRRPSLHTIFSVDNSTGLSDGLAAVQEKKMTVRQISERLAVLPAGRPTSDPMAGLISDRMRRLIEEARAAYDWVIIDTPPVALLPDAHILTSMADGALLVVKAGSTPYPLVKRAADALRPERTLGVVLNRAESNAHSSGYNYYDNYYYSYGRRGESAAQP